ncbi:hypothetical protein ACLSZP_02595 [Avibacterium avium]|uniref:hypothetical protein n=1 Tax=Avibacterium avium TaxID=751 RepID=UPI003BF8C6C1
MKFIEKKIEDNRTGAEVSCHCVVNFNIDYINGVTNITLASYVSKSKKDANKDSLSMNTFTLQSIPDFSENPYEWALKELIKAQPEDYAPEEYEGYVNPYLFANGKIKE